jgi:hypothetical protein
VLALPEIIHESSHHIFGDILLIAFYLRGVSIDLAPEEYQLLILILFGRILKLLILVIIFDGML